MPAPHTCGDAGGTTASGAPCRRRARRGQVCAIHDGTAKVGRPRFAATEEQVAQVEKLAALLTQEQVAGFLGITDDTLRDRIRTDSRIFRAYSRGRARAIAAMANTIFDAAIHGDFNAARFYLATQAGWSTTEKREHSGPDDGRHFVTGSLR